MRGNYVESEESLHSSVPIFSLLASSLVAIHHHHHYVSNAKAACGIRKSPAAVAEIADRTAFVHRVESCTVVQSDQMGLSGYSTIATPLNYNHDH